ncbi:MAG: TRAP transporter large permease subunit [Betaproteobacteria bacterium]|nr:TRAP transporter large permease subunit [Rhodocyclaceae bacterium]MCA3133486.1 TRAP transporter large permease subunit [Rhodocyclaceae bacterium]MCA3141420.1 TRAP transporter large permease subunit [Rhodocyclaceae bacterium]MCA3145751.1 TRAP transporter large permease subunit [Rhodocyclaceae bacterium]MCE2897979.1 TRAP transporter large permease subunit [Betaproteobacteria bacterium]
MTNAHLGMVMLGLIVAAILLGFPIAFTLMGMGILFGVAAFWRPGMALGDNPVFDSMVLRAYGVMTNDVIISVPLFIFMGYIVERSGIIDRLFKSLELSMARVPAALAVATIATCAVFAAATGIVGAVVTLMGLLVLQPMLKAGYDVKMAAGAIAAGGCLGILIPPSVMLILYGATAGVSVVQLYAGAFGPGILLALLYIGYVMVRAKLNPRLAPPLPAEERNVPRLQIARMLLTSFLPLALLIGAVLGSIVGGWATASEAAALGAIGALALAAAYRRLSWDRLKDSVFLTSRTTAMVCWLLVGSMVFSSTFAVLGGQRILEQWVYSMDLSPGGFMLLSQVIIFLLGWPLDWTVIIIIFIPIFLPMLAHFGIDPLFFGLLTALNLQTAFLSPPMAMAAYYLKGVAPPHVTLGQIFSGMVPFMLLQISAMVMLFLFPQIGLWLPRLLYQ